MRQFQMGWNPLWAWVCSILDPQDSIKELLNCVLEGQIRRIIQCCLLDHLGRLSYHSGLRHDEINLQAEQLLYQATKVFNEQHCMMRLI